MRKTDVRKIEDAMAHLIDCNLATVVSMSGIKSKSKSEFERQITIAQLSIDWAREYKVDLSTTRAQKIIDNYDGLVLNYVKSLMTPEDWAVFKKRFKNIQ